MELCPLNQYLIITQIIRHSRLPAGNALWFCQNFILFYVFIFLLPPPRFPDDNFWPPSRTAPEFNRSHVMVIGRSVSFSDPARPPGGGVGPPKHPKIVLRSQEDVFAETKFQLLKTSTPPPPTPTPSPQNTYLNPCAIISTPNNSCVRYGLQPPTHLINRHCQQCLYTWSSLSINVHTISNPQHNDISCIMTRSPSPHKMSRVF